MTSAARSGPPGLRSFDRDRAVGWCELAPRADLAWLARARYLGLVDDLPVWPVPCFYVRSSHRGFEVVARRKPDRPVMRKLLGDVRDFST
jgi:hypothetical protein